MGRVDHSDHGIHCYGVWMDSVESLLIFDWRVGWFAVGAMWNDKALMLVHLVALGAMIAGMASGSSS